MKRTFLLVFLLFISILLVINCQPSSQNTPAPEEQPTSGSGEAAILVKQVSSIFGTIPEKMPGTDKDTEELVKLGEKLYFDKRLLILSRLFIHKKAWWKAWFSSCLTIVSATFFGVTGLYPNMLPSSINSSFSLTIYNASSSPLTLKIMLGVALVFVPIVIIYQAWVYNLFKDKLTGEDLVY